MRKWLMVLSGVVLTGTGLAWAMNVWVKRESRGRVEFDLESVPSRSVAIVPGAHVFDDGRPSMVLLDRLECARQLYADGKVRRILVSGDHQSDAYDEVNAMHRWLLGRGVPSEDVFLDHAGLRTLDTMQRAAEVFVVRDAIVCTQAFHLPRSVFLARRAGIDAVGVAADRRAYELARWNDAREFGARVAAFIDSYLLDTRAKHLGPPMPITGDARITHDQRTDRVPPS